MKMYRVVVNGSEYKVGIEEMIEETSNQPAPTKSTAPAAPKPQPVQQAPQPKPKQPAHSLEETNGTVIAPMPGTIIKVAVSAGDTVSKGQTILVLEAMKMENEIMAPKDGTIEEIKVSEGASVNAGDTLIVLAS